MRQQPIELILLRQWSRELATPILVFDDEDELVFVNPALEELLGLDAEDLVGLDALALAERLALRDARSGEPLAPERLALASWTGRSGPGHVVVLLRDGAGHERRLQLTAVPLEDQVHGLAGPPPVDGDPRAPRGEPLALGAAILCWEDPR